MKLVLTALLLICFGAAGAEFEPNNTFSQANRLALDMNGQSSISGKVSPLGDLDVFHVTTPVFVGRGNLVLRMSPTSVDRELDAWLQLYDATGRLLMDADSGANNSAETLEHHALVGGQSYFAVCRSADLLNSGSGDYSLRIDFSVTSGLFGVVQKPGNPADFPVQIMTFGAIATAIDPNRRTWIVVHGWNSSQNAENIHAAAQALYQMRATDQVLMLDWSSAADTGIFDPLSAENGILPVAKWAADALLKHGFSGTNLNLVGHSFGSYVCDEIAQRIPGGVHTIVTLDPAIDILGGYSALGGEVDFARDSYFSWSFHSSSAGNDSTPTTADEAFIVQSGALTPTTTAHSNVVYLFAYLITHPDDPVAQFFLLNWLLTGTSGPWLPNQYSSSFFGDQNVKGYEAVITSMNGGMQPTRLDFINPPNLRIIKVPQGIAVSWPSFYSGFILETSPSIGPNAIWTRVQGTPEQIGSSNVIQLQGAGMDFFRLSQRD